MNNAVELDWSDDDFGALTLSGDDQCSSRKDKDIGPHYHLTLEREGTATVPPAGVDVSLSVEQAVELRDALGRFIAENARRKR
jgi:hypothetical protein